MKSFKELSRQRIVLLKSSVINTFQNDTAYLSENWGGVLSTFVYTITYIIFIKVIFSNTKLVAGYSYDEIIFFALQAQITFYVCANIIIENITQLIRDINSGALDLILSKPIPTLFYLSFRRIKIVSFLRDGVPTLLILAFLINWNNIHTDLYSILSGIIVEISGLVCFYSIFLISALPAFWIGESENINTSVIEVVDSASSTIPFEGFNNNVKIILTCIFPVLIASALATSVFLLKSNSVIIPIFSVIVAFISLKVRFFLWKVALNNYTSASS